MRSRVFAFPHFNANRRASMRTWSGTELSRLRELAESGIGIAAIAKELRRSLAAVRNKAAMHGIPLGRAKAAT